MDYATFLLQFPEFVNVAQTQVQALLNAAALQVDVNVWGPLYAQGVAYLAAHMLALSPYGQNVRRVSGNSAGGQLVTTYQVLYNSMKSQVTAGYRFVSGAFYSGYTGYNGPGGYGGYGGYGSYGGQGWGGY